MKNNSRYFPNHFENFQVYSVDVNSFYKNLKGTKFNGITKEKLLELKETSKKLNVYFRNQDYNCNKAAKYTKIMNNIKTNPKGFKVYSEAEKFILFMFSVDPNYEAYMINAQYNKTEDIKNALIFRFGIFDLNLIKLERFFVKNFLSEKKRNEINEEIDKRVYK